MRNQPESGLKMFLKLVFIQCCFVIHFIVRNGPEHHSTLI